MTDTTTLPFPSVLPPTEMELAAWRALSCDQQLIRCSEALQAPDAARATKATMADVLTEARQQVAARRD